MACGFGMKSKRSSAVVGVADDDESVRMAISSSLRSSFCEQEGHCLLKRSMPGMSVYSQDELDDIADNLNSRPRPSHAFQSPLGVFARMLEALTHTSSTLLH
jgi:hypothetical protein